MDKDKIARENILRESEEAEGITIRGYDFNNGIDWDKIIDNYATVGAQAANLTEAIRVIKEMRKNKAFIYLGYTSNQVTTGNREIIRYLVEHKLVDVLVTTSGGIEEDIIKCFGDFKLGEFTLSGKDLREKGINRAGNILVPNSRYCKFEDFIMPIFKELLENQKKTGEIISASKLIWKLGEKINNKDSICYWANKNKLPIFCPAPTDGSLGDMIYFFKNKNPEFKLDLADDIVEMNNSTLDKKKTGIILLGGGVIKHHICNANMFRNGANYAVYINTSVEYDGSDSGARPDEAVSWGKLTTDCESVKVYGDTTILLPLIVGKAFIEN